MSNNVASTFSLKFFSIQNGVQSLGKNGYALHEKIGVEFQDQGVGVEFFFSI